MKSFKPIEILATMSDDYQWSASINVYGGTQFYSGPAPSMKEAVTRVIDFALDSTFAAKYGRVYAPSN